MKLYLAGPMRGYPAFNHPAFDTAAQQLRAAGYEVFSPAEHDREQGLADDGDPAAEEAMIRQLMKAGVIWLMDEADAIALLPGWQASSGCRAEVALADAVGMTHAPWREWLMSFPRSPGVT